MKFWELLSVVFFTEVIQIQIDEGKIKKHDFESLWLPLFETTYPNFFYLPYETGAKSSYIVVFASVIGNKIKIPL